MATSELAQKLTPEERIALIHSNLQEVLKPEIIKDIIVKEDRALSIYWGNPPIMYGLQGTERAIQALPPLVDRIAATLCQ